MLAPYLPEEMVELALGVVAQIQTPEDRSDALGALLLRLAKLGEPERELHLGGKFQGSFVGYFRAKLVKDLAPYLPSHSIREAMESL